jgi:hypothetical protein
MLLLWVELLWRVSSRELLLPCFTCMKASGLASNLEFFACWKSIPRFLWAVSGDIPTRVARSA